MSVQTAQPETGKGAVDAGATAAAAADVEKLAQSLGSSSKRESEQIREKDVESGSKHEEAAAADAAAVPVEALEPLDGGLKAWLVVLGVFFANFIAFGCGNSFAVFYRAYLDPSSPFADAGTFRLGFIGGCSVGFAFLMGPLANIMLRAFGVRFPVLVGVLCQVIGLELSSLATAWWHLLLGQGILFGIGASLIFIPSIGLPSQYFDRKKGLATGIAASGSGVGALILAPVTQVVLDRSSIAWALRVVGFIVFGIGLLCVLLLQPRTRAGVRYDTFDLSILKVKGYAIYLFGAFMYMFGYGHPLFTIANFCATISLSGSQSSVVVALMAVGNVVGRLAAGYLADVFGVLNILTLFTFVSGLLCIVLWQFARSFAAVCTFGAFWGFFAGAYWSLSVPASAKIVGLQRLGTALPFNFMANVIPPIFVAAIAARIIQATADGAGISQNTPEAHRYSIIFGGLSMITAAVAIATAALRTRKRTSKSGA